MRRILAFAAVLIVFTVLPLSVPAASLRVDAKSAVLMEVSTGTIVYAQDAHTPLAPASVTKVMTMLLIMEAIDSGTIRWEDSVTASETAAAKGGSQIFLKAGETMTVSDMLKSIAVSSANDCACAMAEHIAGSEEAFVALMNRRAGELGMADTYFVNCTGLDDSENAKDHRTSAHDIAIMSRQLLKEHPDIKKFTTIWMDTVRGGSFGLSNTNKLVRFYEGATGLKTGFTSGAGYCLSASACRDGMELIAVVMGAETSRSRFAACKSLLDHGFASCALYLPDLTEVSPVPVTLGASGFVEPRLGSGSGILIDKAKKAAVTTQVALESVLSAPVTQGQPIGMLTVKAGEEVLSQIPLVAGATVERLSLGELYLQILRTLCMAAPDISHPGANA